MVDDLVCLGETFEDLIFFDLQQWPRLGHEFRTPNLRRTWGGGALLTAVAAARLGCRVKVISALPAGAEKMLRGEGLRVRNLRRRGEPHALTIALSTSEDRAFMTFPGVNEQLETRLLELLPSIRGRHVHLALEPKNCLAWAQALEALRQRQISCSWDFGWHEELPQRAAFPELCEQLHYVFLNQSEAQHYSACTRWEESLDWWAQKTGVVVVKLSKDGCMALQNGERICLPGIPVEAIDSTGAGDAFNGAFLAELQRTGDLAMALHRGNQVGAASTCCVGGLEGLPR